MALLLVACERSPASQLPREDPDPALPPTCREAAAVCGGAAILCGTAFDVCRGAVDCGPCGELATSPPSWRPGPPIPAPSENLHATYLPCAGVLLLEGAPSDRGVFLLDLERGMWTPRTPSPDALHGASLAASSCRLHVLGGGSAKGVPARYPAIYDLAVDRWRTTTSSIPLARYHPAAWTRDDQMIVVAGGNAGDVTLSRVDLFDPRTERWSALPSMRAPRYHHGLVQLPGGDLLVAAGQCCSGVAGPSELDSVERLAAGATEWLPAAPLVKARSGVASAVGADGRAYVAGGGDGEALAFATVEAFDPALDRWTAVAPLRTPRRAAAAATLPDGRIVVAGGIDGHTGERIASVEIYGPAPRLGPGVARPGGRLRVAGDNFAARATVYFYLDAIAPDRFLDTWASSDEAGVLPETTVVLPQATDPGPHAIVAIDSRSRYPVRLAFTVEAP